jgi:Dyp-type peroxidase family
MSLINQNDPQFDDLFRNVQGNILKSHGREHTANIFINCNKNKQVAVRKWIKSLVERGAVTSTKQQLEDTAHFKATGIGGGTFGTILFSAKGYEYLGINTNGKFRSDFRKGMKEADLNDPEPSEWEYGFRGDIHFLVIVGDDDKSKVFTATEILKTEIERFGSVTTIEYGNALRNSDNAGIEHFGYVDGTSQPLFFVDEIERYKADNLIVGDAFIYNPSADKSLILVDDPLTNAKDAFGSYFVFRKLAQNVRGFKEAEETLGEALGLEGEDAERSGAMIVGRFENGTPVELLDEAETDAAEKIWLRNNFDYQTNNNSKCPFHGHIRKANPRSGNPKEDLAGTQSHIMARRGITYGVRNDGPNDGMIDNKPEGGLGLLFMSYQASISNQFEFIQKQWVNNRKFPFDQSGTHPKSGLDPIIGQHSGGNISTGEFAVEWGNINTLKTEPFEHFVTLKGGGYFFSPSIPFLTGLA